jgi:diadenosine tetraphosphatase ApaH/serine/threonine PP2A family protein phosphatase
MPKRFFFRRPAEVVEVHRLPEGERVYAVGDIHGHLDCLCAMEERIEADLRDHQPVSRATVIFLGDYIDRGLASREVVEKLLARRFAGLPARYLLGNHEDAMLHFLASPRDGADWLSFGGTATLASYGVWAGGAPSASLMPSLARQLSERLPPSHLEFLQGLELSILMGGFLFVHAGVRPGLPLAKQSRRDLLTIRDPFLACTELLPWRVVHGHTIVERAVVAANKISLDTGAYATGLLSCAVIEGAAVRLL